MSAPRASDSVLDRKTWVDFFTSVPCVKESLITGLVMGFMAEYVVVTASLEVVKVKVVCTVVGVISGSGTRCSSLPAVGAEVHQLLHFRII